MPERYLLTVGDWLELQLTVSTIIARSVKLGPELAVLKLGPSFATAASDRGQSRDSR